jgi:hypothetical protein
MSMRTLFSVVSLGCLLPLAACEEDDPMRQPEAPVDGAVDMGRDGGNGNTGTFGDASAPNHNDAGMPAADGGVTGNQDGGLPTTGQGAKFFLPTTEPDNTSAPTIELDAQGNVHSVYPAFAGGGAYYAFCAKGECASDEDAQVVMFETDGTVGNAMLALTSDGKPRVLLASYAKLYWAECDSNCGQRASWQVAEILNHGSDKAVTGEALALDPSGRPRFLIHTYRALFGIGQKPPETQLAQCDANCGSAASWSYGQIAKDEIWEGSTLRYDASGRGHVATTIFSFETDGKDLGGYLTCEGACNTPGSWSGIGFFEPYESSTEAVNVHPSVSLALTKAGHPRYAQLHKNQNGVKTVSYFSCEADCTKDNWIYAWSFSGENVHAGLDLALDAQDHPRLVHTVNYDIAISWCNDADCSTPTSKWTSELVESGGDIPADDIFLEWNCTIGAWFLHNPSIAIGSDGKPVIGYQSRDISGGFSQPDPTRPGCVAGTDMTWSRLAVMANAPK